MAKFQEVLPPVDKKIYINATLFSNIVDCLLHYNFCYISYYNFATFPALFHFWSLYYKAFYKEFCHCYSS